MGASFLLLLLGASLQAVGAGRAVTSFSARPSATLATDGVAAQSAVATSRLARFHEALTAKSQMIPGSFGRQMMTMMAGCVCFLVLFKLLSKVDCYSKGLDVRRCKFIARFLLASGWDEFAGFRTTVTVHSVADIINKGMMGGEKLFKVRVAFKWSNFVTSSTGDMRWDQTKGMDVPQGADECVLTLYTEGKIRDTKIGEYVLEVKRDMLDAKKFWGEKKKLKLELKGKLVGSILISFRKGDDDGGLGELPIDGVEEDSALAIAVRESHEEMIKDGVIKKPAPKPAVVPDGESPAEGSTGEAQAPKEAEPEKLEGHLKIDCLGRCITGPLREVIEGKDAGKTFIRVIHCNFAELQGDDMKAEMERQVKKAQEKGLSELPKKWYWVWYEDKKAAFHQNRWHEPDGYLPMTAISKVNRQPERNDQFVVSYSEDGDKKTLVYRREGGKSLDVWLDGLDLVFNECRSMVKEEKDNEERRKKGLPPL